PEAVGFGAAQFNMMRRWCLMLNEELTGSRFMRSSVRPGGVRRDFIKDKEKVLVDNLDKLEKEFKETINQLKCNSLFVDRIENTGIVTPEIAFDLNAVGPAARASGVDRDVRRDYPYAAYGLLDFSVQVHHAGDVGCRLLVKIDELIESIAIIRKCLDAMPAAGPVFEAPGKVKPYKYAYSLTEAPRGENCHWLMSGENNTVFRYKVRTPSFINWPVLCHAVKGNVVPDFPLINKSFNLSYSGNDM
ncbi:MAG: pyridine nucleotide-disulfide oxidoreductase, partial [Clostridiales bacterium]|nr:pyridine nucleotide-disulfide oxidoreductase [Clostridiales bacterium]